MSFTVRTRREILKWGSLLAASSFMSLSRMGAQLVEKSKRGTGPLKITKVGSSRGNVLLKEPLKFEPGFATVPEKPGLGIEFDEKELKKVTVN